MGCFEIKYGSKKMYDKTLAKFNIIESNKYWYNLVNTDIQRSSLFPDNYHDSMFDNK